MKREHGLIVKPHDVLTILAGTKTQMRRPLGGPPLSAPAHAKVTRHHVNDGRTCAVFETPWPEVVKAAGWGRDPTGWTDETTGRACPWGAPGDRLWVRETWANADCMYQGHENDEPGVVAYRADKSAIQFDASAPRTIPQWDLTSWNWDALRWRSSTTMPRRFSRIQLEVTDVRCERLEAISEADARAEGVSLEPCKHPDCDGNCAAKSYRGAFAALWNATHVGGPTWGTEPFVWVVTFRRIGS